MFWRRRAGFRLPCGLWVDPLASYRVLLAGGCNRLLDARETDDPARYNEAETKLCDLVRRAFGLKPFDGGTGNTDEECLAALSAFLDYSEGKGLGVRHSRISSPPTASPAA